MTDEFLSLMVNAKSSDKTRQIHKPNLREREKNKFKLRSEYQQCLSNKQIAAGSESVQIVNFRKNVCQTSN